MKQYDIFVLKSNGEVDHVKQDHRPDLAQLQGYVGGYIETIPHFEKLVRDDVEYRGVCFGNEEGRITNLPLNEVATKAWFDNFEPDTKFWYKPELFGDVVFYTPDDENEDDDA